MRSNTDSRDRQRDLPSIAPLNLRRLRSFRSKNKNQTGQSPTSATTPIGDHITSPLSAGGSHRYYHHEPSASISATNLASIYSPLAAHPAARFRNNSVPFATPRHFTSGHPTVHHHLQHQQQHRYTHSVNYNTASAYTQKRYDETHDPKLFEGGLFINGLAAHPTFAPASEKPPVQTPRTNLVLSPGAGSRGQLQPALRSPGGHFYSYDQQKQSEPEKQLILQSPPVLTNSSRPTQATVPIQISPSKRSPSRAPHRNVELDIDAATFWRDESSLYSFSQPSPPDFNESHNDLKSQTKALAPALQVVASAKMSQTYNISPPSSPDLGSGSNGEGKDSRNVSPFDSSDDLTSSQKAKVETSRRERSNIPAMRRERKNQALRAASSSEQMGLVKPDESSRQVFRVAQGQGMRWDAMTGEPTLGPGRSAQVKPAEYAQGISKSPNTEETGAAHPHALRLKSPQGAFDSRLKTLRSVSQPTSVQGQSRIPQMSPHAQSPPQRVQTGFFSPTESPELQLRPEWKGGSGRTAIVAPVRDTKTGVKARRNPSVSSISSPVASETSRPVPVIRRMAPSKNKDRGRVTPVSSPTSKTRHGDSALSSPSTEQVPSNYPTPPGSVDRKTSQVQTQPQYNSAQQHDVQHYSSQAQLQMKEQPQQSPTGRTVSGSSIRRKPMPNTTSISTTDSPISAAAATGDRSSSMTAWPQRMTDSAAQPAPSLVIPQASVSALNSSATATSTSYSSAAASLSISAVRSPVESIPESPFYEPVRPPSWVQPPSRFSVTTVGTSDYALSPELNAVPEDDSIPSIPEDLSEPAYVRSPEPGSDSILSRPRPKFDNDSGRNADMPIKISLGSWRTGMSRDAAKTTTTSSSSLAPGTDSRLTRQPSSGSVRSFNSTAGSLFNSDTISIHTSSPGVKALPPAPPESSASDRVTHLNALLSALANRRININRSISKMMEMMPRDNLMARPEVLRKREQEKIKVQALRDELAEVQREEYELGIKLHRAYKRLAREGDYENGAALWVRRAID